MNNDIVINNISMTLLMEATVISGLTPVITIYKSFVTSVAPVGKKSDLQMQNA